MRAAWRNVVAFGAAIAVAAACSAPASGTLSTQLVDGGSITARSTLTFTIPSRGLSLTCTIYFFGTLSNGVYPVPLAAGNLVQVGEIDRYPEDGACSGGSILAPWLLPWRIGIGPDFLAPRYTHRLLGVAFILGGAISCGVRGGLQFVYDNAGGAIVSGQLVGAGVPSTTCPMGLAVGVRGSLTLRSSAGTPTYS